MTEYADLRCLGYGETKMLLLLTEVAGTVDMISGFCYHRSPEEILKNEDLKKVLATIKAGIDYHGTGSHYGQMFEAIGKVVEGIIQKEILRKEATLKKETAEEEAVNNGQSL